MRTEAYEIYLTDNDREVTGIFDTMPEAVYASHEAESLGDLDAIMADWTKRVAPIERSGLTVFDFRTTTEGVGQ
ncbi:hypothetical protein FHT44_005098 [Mycolicibacterium sp. BK634]|uniref:hypothetical protein n=1 Tax=Mycolicibacterium sp. BK634 TaxID=2587099 RepID=UPI00161AB8E1|nr:hypothetical protein [Mycolicibacterium sp. BK634]MBB3752586.1 hypothetical protein [Mycolicibacterium sp. BK634]